MIPPASGCHFQANWGGNAGGNQRAHKHFLASVSSVFRKQFFGKLAEEKDVIDIKETTFDASKFLLNYIYTGSEVGVEGENGLEEVFGIINLAEKYDD